MWYKQKLSIGFVLLVIVFVGASLGVASRLYADDIPSAVATLIEDAQEGASSAAIDSDTFSTAHLPFIRNDGQVEDPGVFYYTNTFAGSAAVTASGIRYALPYTATQQDPGGAFLYNPELPQGVMYKDEAGNLKTNFQVPDSILTVEEVFQNAVLAEPTASEPVDADISSFVGSNPDNWHTDLSAFRTVHAGEVWPGVSVLYRATGTNIEKIFTIAPGSDSAHIAIEIRGGTLSINSQGELVITTPAGNVTFTSPVAFQDIDGTRVTVPAAYQLLSGSAYTFTVGEYDSHYPLVIDPLLAGTYVGGTSSDELTGFAVAVGGDVYVSGYTFNALFPVTSGAYSTVYRGGLTDMYIARLSADLSTLKSATFIGGTGIEGTSTSLALDQDGNLFASTNIAAGTTDFPITAGAYDTSYNGNTETALLKFSPDLSTLIASTFIGSAGNDNGFGMVVAEDGSVYRGIVTSTAGLETSGGAYDATWNGGEDVYVIRISSDLTTFLDGTYLGGTANDHVTGNRGMLLDEDGSVLLVGGTSSAGFPTTAGVYDTSHNGSYDIFVSRLSADLGTLLTSTLVGGSGDDDYYPYETLAKAADGTLYIASLTGSANFPVTDGSVYSAGADIAVFSLSSDFTTIGAARYIGGSGNELNYGIYVSPAGEVYVSGYAYSANFPTTAGAYQTVHGGLYDGYISKLSASLGTIASTFFGGTAGDAISHVRVLDSGILLAAGYSGGLATALPAGGYDATMNGLAFDGMLLHLTSNLSFNDPPTASFGNATQSPGTQRVAARVTVTDIEKAETSLVVEYSIDSVTWHNATVSEAYETGGSVSVSANTIASIDTTNASGSKEVVFWWDAGTDVPATTATATLRVTPYDALVAGDAVTSGSFPVNTNTGGGVVAIAPAPVGGGGAAISAPVPAADPVISMPSDARPPIVSPTYNPQAATSAAGSTVDVVLLRFGDAGSLVQALQQLLNRHNAFVATVGAGAPAHETDYFGYRTLAALQRYQQTQLSGYRSPFGPALLDSYVWNELVVAGWR
ncbi:MAG: hypothetical protein KBD66_01940 [Candidatus Doudnabacteria bacterium]|nr:hypothetical protein [Candidatus Doudnabacteria bacterium]